MAGRVRSRLVALVGLLFVVCLAMVIVQTRVAASSYTRLILLDYDLPQLTARRRPAGTRKVSFLSKKDWTAVKEAYSGMWWQSVDGFLTEEWVGFNKLENASFVAFKGDRARTTKDWLDFSVTHLSIFWKHFHLDEDQRDAVAFAKLEQYLDKFVQAAKPLPILYSAAPDTIAVLPFMAPPPEQQDHKIQEKALLATLVSLWESGIARSVVVCGAGSDPEAERLVVELVFSFMEEKLKQRPMKLKVIVVPDLTQEERLNMPQTALHGLELALRGQSSEEETEEWLGDRRNWKFVYFSEPDLILHARPSAMYALKDKMEAGYTMSGHRFHPLAHQDNFPGYKRLDKVLPRHFVPLPPEMDIFDESHTCCDGGKNYPANRLNPTRPLVSNKCTKGKEFWWACGFRRKGQNYKNPKIARQLHGKLRRYQLVRIKDRLPFPLVDNHQRFCVFQTEGKNCADRSSREYAHLQ